MLVKFPIEGLKMAPHVVNPGQKKANNLDDMTYDLFAVCNHYGNMNGGHYTGTKQKPCTLLFLFKKEKKFFKEVLMCIHFEINPHH